MDSALKAAYDYTVYMHLGIDIREACRTKKAGKGQWTYGFVRELLNRDVRLTLFTDEEVPVEWTDILKKAGSRVNVVRFPQKGLMWHWKAARIILDSADMDAYVSTVSYIVPFIIGRRKKVITVVHDLIAFRNEPHNRKATFIERLTLGRAVKNAHLVCTVSDATKSDLLKQYPLLDASRVTTIGAAAMLIKHFDHDSDQSILYVGTLCPRKNQLGLIHAFNMLPAELKRMHPLILVGSRGWNDEKIIEAMDNSPSVRWTSYLSDEDCERLYAKAAVLAIPSLYEGFGMPVLDAFTLGVPVLTSSSGALKEVSGDAAVHVNPLDPADIARGLEKILTDPALRDSLRSAGYERLKQFSWPKTVDRFLKAIDISL